jgi:hypothetical protein
MNFAKELNGCQDFACIFDLVKGAIEATLNKRRTGLILGLSNLPIYIGAYHGIGSNFIVMNKKLLKEVIRTSRDKRLVNSYIFHVLLHEYIHSLGFINERETQYLTYSVSAKILGENHPATQMAKYGINSIFPDITTSHFEPRDDISEIIEIIEDFERENMNYFG